MEIVLAILRCPEGTIPETRRSNGTDIVVGRDPGCQWVLQDPARHLSKRHCAIEFRSGGWQVRDLSTNGTFLNASAEPIGRDRAVPLSDGDRLRLGMFEIEVQVRTGQAGYVPPASPFDLDDPFAPPPQAPAHAPAPGYPSAFMPAAPLPHERADHGFPFPPASGGFGAASPFAQPQRFDPFTGMPPVADHVSSVHDAFEPPRATSAPAALPDDWDWDPLADKDPPGAGPSSSGHSATPPRIAPQIPLPGVVQAPGDLPAPPPGMPQHGPLQAAPAGQDALLAAFLAAAGMPPASLPPQADPVATMRTLGAAFGAAMQGMQTLLMARGKVKQEFRIEQTMLRPAGNNPLKFATSQVAAIQQMIAAGEGGAASAVRSVVADLEAHEVATMVATQAAAKALLDRLSPDAVEAEAPQGALALLPMQRRARLWEEYARHHARVTREFDDDFDSAFGKAFARAYERAAAAGRQG